MKPRIAFLGPSGTFTEQALRQSMDVTDDQLVPYPTIPQVLGAVEQGDVDKGIVAIENSIEGSVNATLDVLAFEANLLIEKEIVAPVAHKLLVKRGVKVAEIKGVVSHPQATAQCRVFLTSKFPDAVVHAANSTAEAAKIVAEGDDRSLAAIGTELAADIYGLDVIKRDIEDFRDNQTRFVLVSRDMPPRSGRDKTSVVCFIFEDRPGSLLQILQEFAYRHINLTKIQSRPTRKQLGEYCFFVDMEGHVEDAAVADALKCLRCKLRQVKLLGSYPRARSEVKGHPPRGCPASYA